MEQKYNVIVKFERDMLELEKAKENQIQSVVESLSKSYVGAKTQYMVVQENRNLSFQSSSVKDSGLGDHCGNFSLNNLTKEETLNMQKIKKCQKKLINDSGYIDLQIVTDLNKIDQMNNEMRKNIQNNIDFLKTLNIEVKVLETKNNHFKEEEIQLKSAIAAAQQNIESFEKSKNDEINILEEEIDAIEKQITEVNNRIETLKQNQNVKEPSLKKILVE